MRGVPYREATGTVQAGKEERSAQRRNDERQCRNDWNRVQPRHAIEQPRSRREVEDRQSDGRKGQRACDPREDGQNPGAKRQDSFFAEQGTAAADGAERQCQHTQTSGQVVAAHQQQDECRAGKDRHLHDHPEMPACPAVSAGNSKSLDVCSVDIRGGPVCWKDRPLDRPPDSHPVGRISHCSRRWAGSSVPGSKYRVSRTRATPGRHAMNRCHPITPSITFARGVSSIPRRVNSTTGVDFRRRTRGRDAYTEQWTREVLSNVRRTRFDRQVRCWIAGEECAGSSGPEVRPHDDNLENGGEDRKRDDGDDQPRQKAAVVQSLNGSGAAMRPRIMALFRIWSRRPCRGACEFRRLREIRPAAVPRPSDERLRGSLR